MARSTSIINTRQLGPSTITTTTTLTLDHSASSSSSQQPPLVLRLKPTRKKVTWKEGTVDNEFLQKKSSKKCCIFHKDKPFDEDDSDGDDDNDLQRNKDHDHARVHAEGCCSSSK